MENKKKFLIPEAILIDFSNEDIITGSGDLDEYWGGNEGDEYQD